MRKVWRALNDLHHTSLLGEGRVYGGGLHKLEPNELGNVDASAVAELIPEVHQPAKLKQMDMFQRNRSLVTPGNKRPQVMSQAADNHEKAIEIQAPEVPPLHG